MDDRLSFYLLKNQSNEMPNGDDFIYSFSRSKLVSCISYILPLLTACDLYTDMKPVGVHPFFI